jgi:hypothetical protein
MASQSMSLKATGVRFSFVMQWSLNWWQSMYSINLSLALEVTFDAPNQQLHPSLNMVFLHHEGS